jgi:hypothetical protein
MDKQLKRRAMERHIAFCWLLLKGDHWVPVSPDRHMKARDRSSPDGPVIMAELAAEVEGAQIVGWRKRIGAVFRDVARNGEVLPLDVSAAVLDAGSGLADAMVSSPGVIGINSKLAERRLARERKIPEHLYGSAFARAQMQILDKLNGSKAVGVKLCPIPDAPSDQQT